jgi:hypothetical protein
VNIKTQSVVGYILIAAGIGQIFLQADWIGVPWPIWVCALVGMGVALVWTDKRGMDTRDGIDALDDAGGPDFADGD